MTAGAEQAPTAPGPSPAVDVIELKSGQPTGVQVQSAILESAMESMMAIHQAVLRSGSTFWTSALDRKAWPIDLVADLLTWSSELSRRRKPEWASPNKVIGEWPVARLRDFSPAATGEGEVREGEIATLLLPPQAGHDSCIVDFAPGQSQVHTALESGLTRVYSMDWKGATARTKDATIEDFLVALEDSVELVGGQVNLVGDCQGGWLAVVYAALHPDKIRSLTIAGAPVDFHAGEPIIHEWVQALTPGDELAVYRSVVAANGGVLPGEFLLNGFKALQPNSEVQRQLGVLANLHDPIYLERYRKFEDWFTWTQPLPGEFYLWIVQRLFQRNELVNGTLTAGGRRVDLRKITCPLFLLAGAADHITPPPQVFALADHAGTPADQVHMRTAPGGHLGLFMGHQALREHWKPLFAELAALP